MKQNVLTASEGMIFTDGTIYGRKIYLQDGRNPDDFYEITEEEYEKQLEPEVNEDVEGGDA